MKSIDRISSFPSFYNRIEENSSRRNSFSSEHSFKTACQINSEETDYIIEVPDNKGKLFHGLVAELRFNNEENKLFAKPLYANSKDLFTLPTLMMGALTIAIIESLIVNYATPQNKDINHFLSKTLPSKITYTGETVVLFVFIPVMISSFFTTTCYCIKEYLCCHSEPHQEKTPLIKYFNKSNLQHYLLMFFASQVLNISAAIEKDYGSNNLEELLKTLPNTNQYLLPTLMMIGNYFKKKYMPRHIEGEQIKADVNYDA